MFKLSGTPDKSGGAKPGSGFTLQSAGSTPKALDKTKDPRAQLQGSDLHLYLNTLYTVTDLFLSVCGYSCRWFSMSKACVPLNARLSTVTSSTGVLFCTCEVESQGAVFEKGHDQGWLTEIISGQITYVDPKQDLPTLMTKRPE